mmetsp:Transcript_9236/g.10539  ORF Transcript_9236/g.10539 Transcript_9236/m.10539 type:complete len:309 (-) Transcript_9236:135-1061(-)|eukprot:CAMPEP_0194140518 /NCGR_PEP_ID=MMETSP0152-20130528/10058_1 /TAXON_ID=1049557 /ORGANISM="Thalassiothrix antarctica, Strain L6-D1" /LENGTH=308 /DNA_ID=CAMNT_0038838795 /DNA_START=93 /DNA_END=1019 /DNA_ORIENTATION=-
MYKTGRTGDAAIGMMDKAYFTGRKELLDFFNDLLALNLTKIEQTASGAVACQITDYLYPGSIPMSRVNWDAKSDYEYVQNYKLLQAAFKKNKIERYVDVEKLIKAKYQDNLEFCQWLKAFFDQSGSFRDEYDPVEVRSRGKGGKKVNQTRNKNQKVVGARSKTRPLSNRSKDTVKSSSINHVNKESKGKLSDQVTDAVLADAQLMKENSELATKVALLEKNMLEIETERDFYFEKLRDVEILLQVYKESEVDNRDSEGMVEKVFKVLYATAEEQITVGDDGEITKKEATVSTTKEDLNDEYLDNLLVD